MAIRVEQGKGKKDRYTILSPRLLEELRRYWKQFPTSELLFSGKHPERPLDETAIQKAYSHANTRAGIRKRTSVHTLRHCFATHLLEMGVDVRTIQVLMGHTDLRTISRYLQIRQHYVGACASKFDLLALPLKLPGI